MGNARGMKGSGTVGRVRVGGSAAERSSARATKEESRVARRGRCSRHEGEGCVDRRGGGGMGAALTREGLRHESGAGALAETVRIPIDGALLWQPLEETPP
eukprot:4243129-Prymnesium_polylepis.1